MSKEIIVKSKLDNYEIKTNSITASLSTLLRTLIEEYENEYIFLISDIKGETLEIVIKYLDLLRINNSKTREIPKPLKNYDLKEYVDPWEYDFIQMYDNRIYDLLDLINAANFMDIPPLIELACAKAATIAKDFDKETFMEVFQLEQDLDEETLKEKIKEFEKEKEKENGLKISKELEKVKEFHNVRDN